MLISSNEKKKIRISNSIHFKCAFKRKNNSEVIERLRNWILEDVVDKKGEEDGEIAAAATN